MPGVLSAVAAGARRALAGDMADEAGFDGITPHSALTSTFSGRHDAAKRQVCLKVPT
jgi:hypothetical protein